MNKLQSLPAAGLLALAAGALAAAPFVASPFMLSMVIACLMYIGLTTSWAMFSGPSHYLSLATYAFFGLGVYTAAIASDYLPWPLLILAGGLAAALFAMLIGAFILHLRGAYFAVLTFGLGQVAMLLVTYGEKTFAGSVGRVMTQVPSDLVSYWTILLVALASIALYVAVGRSRLGHALRAIGMDEVRAATFGVHARQAKLVGFALSALMAGAMGAAMAARWSYIEPLSAFNPFIVFQTVLIAMVGGPMKLRGPILASVLFSILSEAMRLGMPNGYMIILGTILVLSALYLPNGISGIDIGRRQARRPAEAKP
ncbi:MAG: branched-chain amino acid ABC transporter permease [Noviherbaspirillum sp.]